MSAEKAKGDRPICSSCRVFGPPESGCYYHVDQVKGSSSAGGRTRPTAATTTAAAPKDASYLPAKRARAYSQPGSHSPQEPTALGSLSQTSLASAAREPASPPISLNEILEVKGVPVSMRLIESFFRYPGSVIPFTFLERGSFIANIRSQNPFLLSAMQCMAFPYADDVSSPSDNGVDVGEMHFQTARDMIADLYDNHSLAAVQGLLIMSSCSAMRGLTSAGWQYIGMAARMAHYLALESANVGGVSYPPIKEEMRRRTWTACLTLERLVWLSVDVPSIFANVPVRVRQHIPDNLWQSVWPGDRNKEQKGPFQETALCGYYKQLMVLYGKSLDYVRADNGIRMIINYQALDAEIDAWFLSLPTPVRDLVVPPEPHLVRADAPPHFWFAYTIASLGIHARGVLRKSLLNAMLSDSERVVAAAAFALNAEPDANFGARGNGPGAPPIMVDAHGLLAKILFDALSVADEHTAIVRHGLLRNPYLIPTTPHLSMGVYQVGLVYVIALGRAVTEGDKPMIARCVAGLTVHEQALGAWAHIFSPAHRRLCTLKDLHAAARSGHMPGVNDGSFDGSPLVVWSGTDNGSITPDANVQTP